MRFQLKPKPELEWGDKKQKVKFLFLPLKINNELRWLEFAKIEYMFSGENKWLPHSFLPYDPVKDCEQYKRSGCAHVDGFACNIDTCNFKY